MSNRNRVLLPRGQIWPSSRTQSQASHLHKKITSFAQKKEKRFNCENPGKKITLQPSASFLLVSSECFSDCADQARFQPPSRRNSVVVESGMLQPDETFDPDLETKQQETQTGLTVPDG